MACILKKYLLVLCLLSVNAFLYSQKIKATHHSKQKYLDSLVALLTPEEYDSLKTFLEFGSSPKLTKGYFDLSLGLTNGQLSYNNNITSEVQYSNLAIFNPYISYTSKWGVGMSYDNNTVFDKGKATVLQHTASLFYNYFAENRVSLEASFSKYFTKDSSKYNSTLFDYGFSVNFKYLKKFIQPIVAFSYDKGTFDEVFLRRTFSGAKITSVSAIVGVQHQFNLTKATNEHSLVQFVPKILLNAASMKYKTSFVLPRRRTAGIMYMMNNNLIPRNISEQFKPQSIGLELELSYFKKNFYLYPNIYIDYSLQKLDSESAKRVYVIAGITAGISF